MPTRMELPPLLGILKVRARGPVGYTLLELMVNTVWVLSLAWLFARALGNHTLTGSRCSLRLYHPDEKLVNKSSSELSCFGGSSSGKNLRYRYILNGEEPLFLAFCQGGLKVDTRGRLPCSLAKGSS